MRIETRRDCDLSPSSHASASTGGYTGTVNAGQHTAQPTRNRGLLACLAFASIFCSNVALAQPKPAPKSPKAPSNPAALPENRSDDSKAETPEQRASRGVVTISRAGIPIALGSVLANDGRILTALSPIGSGNDLEAKFADGSTHRVKLGHHDRVWDLALLVPQAGKWTEGLTPSSLSPTREDAEVKAFSTLLRATPAASTVDVRSIRTMFGADDKPLDNAIELGSKVSPVNLGSPLIDETGRVVGVVGRGCLPIDGKPCLPVAFGVPTHAIKSFLKSVPADAVPPSPWLGIQGAKEVLPVAKGVRIISIAKGSPASAAKLRGGDKSEADTILAVAGEPVTTPEELSQAIRKRAIGEKVPLTIFGNGAYRTVDVMLGGQPDTSRATLSPPPSSLIDPFQKRKPEPNDAKRPKPKPSKPEPRSAPEVVRPVDPFSAPL